MNHWGVLVTEYKETEIKAMLLRTCRRPIGQHIQLGSLFELRRDQRGITSATHNPEFGTSDLFRDWPMVCSVSMGSTLISNNEIEKEGKKSGRFYVLMSSLFDSKGTSRLSACHKQLPKLRKISG